MTNSSWRFPVPALESTISSRSPNLSWGNEILRLHSGHTGGACWYWIIIPRSFQRSELENVFSVSLKTCKFILILSIQIQHWGFCTNSYFFHLHLLSSMPRVSFLKDTTQYGISHNLSLASSCIAHTKQSQNTNSPTWHRKLSFSVHYCQIKSQRQSFGEVEKDSFIALPGKGGHSRLSSVPSLSHVWLFVTPWTAAYQASLSITNSQSLLKLMFIESVMPLNHLDHLSYRGFVVPFSFCLQSFPASGSFPMSQFFASGVWSIGVSASASVLPMNIQDWFPLGWTGGSPCSPRGSQESFPTPPLKSINFSALSFLNTPTLRSIHDY